MRESDANWETCSIGLKVCDMVIKTSGNSSNIMSASRLSFEI